MKKAELLVIEDNREVRENLAEILELYGYVVRTAPDGMAGARAAMQQPPDLILCDIMMPELDGFGVLNLLAENERTATVPFIFITARADTKDRRRGMNLGAEDYITKPFYKDELLRVVELRLKKVERRKKRSTALAVDRDRGAEMLAALFAEGGSIRSFESGQLVVREGDRPGQLFRISTGRVQLIYLHEYGREYATTVLGPEDIVGLPTVVAGLPYSYSARVVSSSLTCRDMPAAAFMETLRNDPGAAAAVQYLLARHALAAEERMVGQAYDSVRRRMAQVLTELDDVWAGQAIDLSREELARLVGTTKESVSRTLADFRKENLVAIEGREVRIMDSAGLSEVI